MRLPSGTTDQYVYFVAVDATDLTTRETGLASFTVYRSRDGGAAAAMTTPTINETDATNMPGVYELLLDEDTTIASGNDSEEMALHITHAGMAPVTRVIELYRPKITAGETLTVASGIGSANAVQISGDATAADNLEASLDGTGGVTLSLANLTIATSATVNANNLFDAGDVSSLVDDIWDEVLTAATHNVASSAGRRLRTLQTGGNYEGGAVWIDTVNGTAGTTADENGVVTNPVDSLADALTLAAATNLKRFQVTGGSSLTFAATMDGYILDMNGSVLDLGGQSIDSTSIRRGVVLSSTGTSVSATPSIFEDCSLGPNGAVTLGPTVMFHCGLYAVTFGSAGNFAFVDCHSAVPGSSTPTVDFGAGIGACNVEFRRWSGGLTLNNVGTGDVVSVDVVSGGTITVNGTGGTVLIRGICAVVDGSGGAVSVTQSSVVNMTKINAEVDTAIGDAALATAAALATVDGNVDAILADTNELQIDWADGGRLDLILDTAATAGDPWSTSLPGAYGAGTAGYILGTQAADGSGLTEAGGTGDHLTAIPWNSAWDAEVQSEAADALNAYDPPTKAEMDAAISAISTGTGSGAYTITVTVTDGTDPLQNAVVRILDGSTTMATGTTDASGNVEFSLDAATYTVAITKVNYQFTPASRTVTGDETGTLVNDLVMTALAISAVSTGIRTVSFDSVLNAVARRQGIDPSVFLQTNVAASLCEYLNAAYEFIWRWYQWPEAISIEQVTFASQTIARTGVTAYPLADLFQVTQAHPVTSQNPQPVDFKLTAGNVYVPVTYASSALYVTYRRPVPVFTTTAYDASATYAVDDLVKFTDGDCYKCIDATSAGESPTTHAAKWQKQEIIDYLKNALIHGAMIEALGEEGQYATSLIEDQKLQAYLEHELDRIELDERQYRYLSAGADRR